MTFDEQVFGTEELGKPRRFLKLSGGARVGRAVYRDTMTASGLRKACIKGQIRVSGLTETGERLLDEQDVHAFFQQRRVARTRGKAVCIAPALGSF